MLNSNSFTIKNKHKEIPIINYNKNDKIINNEKKLKKYFNFAISSNDKNISIIFSALKYIDKQDYPKLIMLNKNYYNNFSKLIYSKVLLSNSALSK